jgi:hypothetical protein
VAAYLCVHSFNLSNYETRLLFPGFEEFFSTSERRADGNKTRTAQLEMVTQVSGAWNREAERVKRSEEHGSQFQG